MNKVLTMKYKGCLLGLACGDYLGATVEYRSRENVRRVFASGVKPLAIDFHGHGNIFGFYTDDTSQMICLAESLIEHGFNPKDQLQRYKKWLYEGYATPFGQKSYGVGQNTLRILMRLDENLIPDEINHDPKQGGNGAVMRCAPIALAYHHDSDQLREYSIKSAIVTHNNVIAAWSTVVLNCFIAHILRGVDKKRLPHIFHTEHPNAPAEIKELITFNFKHIHEDHLQTTGFSLYTLAIALWAFMTTNNYENCITKAILIGGDTDTQAAVAGALAGAYYGVESIPTDWLDNLLNRDYIEDLAGKLANMHT